MKFSRRLLPTSLWRNWPLIASLTLVIGACALYGAAHIVRQKTLVAEQQAAEVQSRATPSVEPDTAVDATTLLPDHAGLTRDLATFFKIAADSAIEIGAIDYRLEENARLPFLVIRSMEFRVTDEYPKVKAFLSRVLQKLPHASLQEIRIEKKDTLTAQAAIQIKLVLLYRASSPTSEGSYVK